MIRNDSASGAVSALEANVLAQVDRMGPEIIAFLQRLVSFRTASQNPDDAEYPTQALACVDFVDAFLRDNAFETQRWDAAPSTFAVHPVLAARLLGRGGGRSITVNGHLDVVPVGDWTNEVREGALYGRGSLDMKGGIASALMAVKALRDCGCALLGDLWVHLVTDEEVVGWGTRECVERLPPTDAVIDPEPTDLTIIPIEGGLEHVRIEVEGLEAHAGARWRSIHAGGRQGGGVNAIEKMLQILAAIQHLERDWANAKAHPLFPAGFNSILPGIIMGGPGGGHDGKINMVTNPGTTPNYCSVEYNIWYYPFETIDQIKEEFERYVLNVCRLDPWLRAHPPRFTWALRNIRFPPFSTDPDHDFVRITRGAVADAGVPPRLAGFSAVADLAWYSKWAIPGVLFGAGDVSLAHGPNEHVAVGDIITATRALALLLMRWCGHASQ